MAVLVLLFFARQLHHLGSTLHPGDIVALTNYISQCLDDNKVVVIRLNVTVVAVSVDIIGNPSDFMMVSKDIRQPVVFIGSSVSGFCSDCQQNPYDWSMFGPTIVGCVRSMIGSTLVASAHINKQCHFASYQMYTRAKLGYLGKGNIVPLLSCVSNGVKNNFWTQISPTLGLLHTVISSNSLN
jgi:hypothetical protein